MTESKDTTVIPVAISGIDVMRGVGAVRAKGFWADAWGRVLKRPGAIFGMCWIGVIAFFAVFGPIVANAHPLTLVRVGAGGTAMREWPLFANLTPTDWALLIGCIVGLPWIFIGPRSLTRAQRLGIFVVAALQVGFTIVIAGAIVGLVSLLFAMAAAWIPTVDSRRVRVGAAVLALLVGWGLSGASGGATLINFERYLEDEQSGAIREVTWTLIPWSPQYSRSDMVAIAPGERVADVDRLAQFKGTSFGERRVLLGTDALGGDVLSQMLWACRLSISIGLVSTGISVVIGVTMGAIMGYFGGKVDMILFRIVEIFMAVPVLFLLIVAAGVLPRDTYVMMAIIGCFSWTGAARFTRAEFMKLRNQDFVQAAKATGLPLRAILFRHMLPNGVTPVLVDASFAIAAAISIEATLSYLGLGPDGQASWGKLLSSATAATGTFVWWLAVFPGIAIFLSVLSYNMLGEAMRDAIDPKLRKAAH